MQLLLLLLLLLPLVLLLLLLLLQLLLLPQLRTALSYCRHLSCERLDVSNLPSASH